MKLLITFFISFCFVTLHAEENFRVMLGYVDMREACIWIQTDQPDSVFILLNGKDQIKNSKIFSGKSEGRHAYTCHMVLHDLAPGMEYDYIIVGGSWRNPKYKSKETYHFKTQALWQYRTSPPNFTVATGSCAFINESEFDRPGEPYGGGYEIFNSIAGKKPDIMLWLGDNIYLREVDFGSQSGIAHRYTHGRALPELQSLLTSCANYAIWDDHDYGPNDSNGNFIHKDWTAEAFRQFWANPSYGISGKDGSITTQFQWSDIDFFLLDNRYFRINYEVKNAGEPTVLGEEQVQWLIQSLKFSRAPFKIIAMGGQFLNTDPLFENYINWSKERQHIIDAIEANHITGVVFLTGDRHCGELSELKLSDGNVIYDLTVSPLTSKFYDISKEKNTLRLEGTLVPERHFATLGFSGDKGKRIMTISTFNTKGELKYEKKIDQVAK
jgi:alkaline phosphatase D